MINKIKSITGFKFQDSRFKTKGFTLVELLVVIGIIAILFAVVLVAINPAKRFAESSNARRLADVNSILGGITTSTVDKKGTLPSGLTTGSGSAITPSTINAIKPRFIGTGTTDISTAVSTTFQANSCYGIGTCAVTGFACTTNADCPTSAAANVCNTTASRCTVSGGYCTVDANCSTVSQYCVSASYCAHSGNPCTVNNGVDATNCAALSGNTCSSDKIGYKRPYNLSTSTEGIVPDYIGAMPKDPAGSGFMGTSPTLGDTQTGYAVFNVPSTLTSSTISGVTMNAVLAAATAFTTSVSTTINAGSVVVSSLDTNNQYRVVLATTTGTSFTVDQAYGFAIPVGGTITVYSPSAVASATNRIKVVACNPNDADSDGSYTNNKIEVLR